MNKRRRFKAKRRRAARKRRRDLWNDLDGWLDPNYACEVLGIPCEACQALRAELDKGIV